MANKQRGPLPPVLSTEETRVKPPDPDEADLPPEDPSWDPQRDQTQLLPKAAPVQADWDEQGGEDDATPPVPRKVAPIPMELPDFQAPEDATRPIPRKTGARPALEDADATRNIPRKSAIRPSLPDDNAARHPPRKTGTRPALQDPDATRVPVRKSGSVPTVAREAQQAEPPLPWDAEADQSSIPTRAQSLPPIVSGPEQSLVYPPEGPPVLVPTHTEPHYLAQAPVVPLVTQPNYVPPPPPVLNPVVTAPHLLPSAPPPSEPPREEIRTTFSNKAAMVADLVRATFARRSYGTAPYRLRIDEPDGPSTAGGLLARQPISLVSNLESAPSISVGWVDVAKKEAQLRSYGVVVRRHQSRHGGGLDILEQEYEQFFNELVETLFYGGIKILVLVPDEPDAQQSQAQAQAPPQSRGRSPLVSLILFALIFALGLAVGMNLEHLAPLLEGETSEP